MATVENNATKDLVHSRKIALKKSTAFSLVLSRLIIRSFVEGTNESVIA